MIDEPGHARCAATMSMNVDTCTHCGQRRGKNAVALAQNDDVLGSLVDFEADGTEKWHYNLKEFPLLIFSTSFRLPFNLAKYHTNTAIMFTRRHLKALASGRLSPWLKPGRSTLIVRKDHTKWECNEKVGTNEKGEPIECLTVMEMSEGACKNKECSCIRRAGAAAMTDDGMYLGVLVSITKGVHEWWEYFAELQEGSCEEPTDTDTDNDVVMGGM
ncbi:hypothetical protein F52700_7986 [Fusarium sp. NRRL 52700]|nr:hypothetical protein F52700_7986 [Fusarium sp. NRRL 52700]